MTGDWRYRWTAPCGRSHDSSKELDRRQGVYELCQSCGGEHFEVDWKRSIVRPVRSWPFFWRVSWEVK